MRWHRNGRNYEGNQLGFRGKCVDFPVITVKCNVRKSGPEKIYKVGGGSLTWRQSEKKKQTVLERRKTPN